MEAGKAALEPTPGLELVTSGSSEQGTLQGSGGQVSGGGLGGRPGPGALLSPPPLPSSLAKCKSGVLPGALATVQAAAGAGTRMPQEACCLLSLGQWHPRGPPSAQTSEAVSVELSSRVVLIRYSWASVSFRCWAEIPGWGSGCTLGEAPKDSSLLLLVGLSGAPAGQLVLPSSSDGLGPLPGLGAPR